LTKRALAALIACLALAVVAAACGGGGDSTSSGGDSAEASGSAPTKAVFIKEADAICGAANELINEEIVAFAKKNDIPLEKELSQKQKADLFVAVVLPNVSKERERIDALTPPTGDEATVAEILDTLGQDVEDAEADPKQATEGKNPLADASKLARAYGMKVCGAG
jgi:hypothetical protein